MSDKSIDNIIDDDLHKTKLVGFCSFIGKYYHGFQR